MKQMLEELHYHERYDIIRMIADELEEYCYHKMESRELWYISAVRRWLRFDMLETT